MSTLRETLSLTRIDTTTNEQEPGGIPQVINELTTTSNKVHNTVQVVGTTEEAIGVGDLSGDVMVYLRVRTAAAIVQVGPKPAATFYPMVKVEDDHGWLKLGLADTLSELFIKSDTVSTEVELVLHEIAS